MTDVTDTFDTVLVVDFGAQYAQLIARRVREAHVYSEIVPHTITPAEVAARQPKGIIFSGGPKSVHVEGAPTIDPGVYDTGVPVLGICYGAQLMALELGGRVERTGASEFGKTPLAAAGGALFSGLPDEQQVWMSHRDSVTAPPEGAEVTASSPTTPIAAFEARERNLYGVQFHPEVVHTPHGTSRYELPWTFSTFDYRTLCRLLWEQCDAVFETAKVNGRTGRVAAGVRPEKITLGSGGGANELAGTVLESAYIGVATQVVVRTPSGVVQVFAQNIDAGGRVPALGSNVILSWSPEATFVVARDEMEEQAAEEEEVA